MFFHGALILVGLAAFALSSPAAATLEARVQAELSRRGLGADALLIPDNLIRHEIAEPRATPPLVRELIARPLAAADAAALFERSVPDALKQFRRLPAPPPSADFEALLERYVGALSAGDFLDATAAFVTGLRSPGLVFPPPQRRQTAIGALVIGSFDADRHGPEAALIIDPGGDDLYRRAPPPPGAFSVIIDLAGNDTYEGSDVAEGAFSALVDLAGNDRYVMQGAGLAAARHGTSLLFDAQGDDYYEAGAFGLGAAAGAASIGALIDLAGNDRYRVGARGQGHAAEGGLGLLWDAAGDDEYLAGGEPDFWQREAGQSFAQGAAVGTRNTAAGGIGILRDERGDDRYEAQMFAQGSGYYFALGLLWDGGGADRYRAVRYAQGAGVHQALGVLRDESGDDDYALSGGVGQGTGHDMAIGVLLDAGGEDRYAAQYAAQGTALSNGIGLLADLAGGGRWQMGPDRLAWGEAEGGRGLPSIGLLLHDALPAAFERPALPVPSNAPPEPPACPAPAAEPTTVDLVPALRLLGRDLALGRAKPAAYASVLRRLIDDPRAAIAALPPEDFSLLLAFGQVLRCAASTADDAAAARLWAAFEDTLAANPATPFAGAIGSALVRRPAPPALQARLRAALQAHPSCAVRSQALLAWPDEALARAALASPCWRLQAAARRVLNLNGDRPHFR